MAQTQREAAAAEVHTHTEQLRVAEEELRQRHGELEAVRASLEAERARYGDLFEFAPVAYLVTDANGTIMEANRPAAAMLNVEEPFLVGKPLARFVAPEDRRRLRSRLARVDVEADAWDLRIVPRKRSPVHVEAVVRHSTEPGAGELRWMLRDVEERRRAEHEIRSLHAELERRVSERSVELAAERARLNAIVRQMPGGVIIAERPSGRLLYANEAAERLIGKPILAGAGEDVVAIGTTGVDQPAYAPYERALVHALETGDSVVGELVEISRPDGTHAVLEISASPIRDADGEVAAAVALLFDVTERERKERAERDFITNAAHELQTPLAGIMSAVDVLQAGAKNDPRDRERFLEHLERECRRLDRLARALLVLARVQVGVEEARRELVELRPLLDEAARELAPAPGVEVAVDCPPELALVTHRDVAAQLLANLGTNAAKFTSRGSVTFRARRGRGDFVVIEVADTGSGIAPAEQERVFERFYRVGDDSRRHGGVGLGLAIAKAATDALGGSLELRSAPGRGTTVRVSLPGATLVRR
jgi:PAS domain S-box-containing protein